MGLLFCYLLLDIVIISPEVCFSCPACCARPDAPLALPHEHVYAGRIGNVGMIFFPHHALRLIVM